MSCNTLCQNAYHNNAESLINFAPGVIPIKEQLEPYTQEYLGENVIQDPLDFTSGWATSVSTIDGEKTVTATGLSGGVYQPAGSLIVGQKYVIRAKGVTDSSELRIGDFDSQPFHVSGTFDDYYVIIAGADRLRTRDYNGAFPSTTVFELLEVYPVYTHHKNLVTNGGLPYGTDWINPTLTIPTGLAEGWSAWNPAIENVISRGLFTEL